MKKLIALALSITFIVGIASTGYQVVKEKQKLELSQAITQAPISVEVKEALKVDDAEYVGYVTTKSSLGSGSWISMVSLISMFALIGYLFKGLLKAVTFKRLALSILFVAGVVLFFNGHTEAGILMASTPPVLGDEEGQKALLEKVKTESSEASKKAIESFKEEFKNLAEKAKTGMLSQEAFDTKMKELSTKLEQFDSEKFKEYQEKLDKATKALEIQDAELKKIKESGIESNKGKSKLRQDLSKFLQTEEWKNFVESGGKRKAEMQVKVVDVTNDYTGSSFVHITSRDPRVVDHPQVTRLNIRDLLSVSPHDLPYLAFTEVYDWDRNIGWVAENTALSESSFKVREATTQFKRVGTFIELSKTMLQSRTFVENHIATRLPALVRYAEDFQLLFGDGASNRPTGIFKVADNFADIINSTITGLAGSVSSVATYDGGAKALITFAANQNINNGDNITIANATETTYNDTFSALVISPKQIVIEKAYVAEADTSAWTFVVSSKFKNRIEAAQEIDVLKVAKTLVTRQEYACNGIVLHPDDATIIETLKGNDEHYIDVKRLENGVLTIAGVPVVETTAMPSGKFAVGDWQMACALLEFESVNLEFSESTEEKKKDTVVVLIQEKILFPIYNKYMFVVGDFASAKEAIQFVVES